MYTEPSYRDQFAALCQLAKKIHRCGQVQIVDKQLVYQVKPGGIKYPMHFKILEPFRIMEDLHSSIQAGQSEYMLLFSVMCFSNPEFEKYIEIYGEAHIQFFELNIRGNMLNKFVKIIDRNWENLRLDTQMAFLKQASNSIGLYNIVLTKNRAEGILNRERLLEGILKNHPCPWDVYAELIQYFNGRYVIIHITYLNKCVKKFKRDKNIQDIFRPYLKEYSLLLSKCVKDILGYSGIIVSVRDSRVLRMYSDPEIRRVKSFLFTASDWLKCFEAKLGKEEFMRYVKAIKCANVSIAQQLPGYIEQI